MRERVQVVELVEERRCGACLPSVDFAPGLSPVGVNLIARECGPIPVALAICDNSAERRHRSGSLAPAKYQRQDFSSHRQGAESFVLLIETVALFKLTKTALEDASKCLAHLILAIQISDMPTHIPLPPLRQGHLGFLCCPRAFAVCRLAFGRRTKRTRRYGNARPARSAALTHARNKCGTLCMPTIERIGRLKGDLTITCWSCKHRVTWSRQEAAARLGGECMVTDARRRLSCSACGERGRGRVEFSS
jgi:hypothetical protein